MYRSIKTVSMFVAGGLIIGFLQTSSMADQDLSADMVATQDKKVTMKGKVYMKGTKIRQDLNSESGKQTIIIRPDKKVMWMVMPQNKMIMEMPLNNDTRQQQKTPERWTQDMEKKSKYLGKEKVRGKLCRKYLFQMDEQKTYYWVLIKNSLPVKVVSGDVTMEYLNISNKNLPASLFEVPAGYQKMTMPGMGAAMMQGMMQGMMGGQQPQGSQNHLSQ